MKQFFKVFFKILQRIENEEIKQELLEIYDKISRSSHKMASATKFIDFFVHDILDYTILNKNETKFNKNITMFDVTQAVNEIIDTLHDKA